MNFGSKSEFWGRESRSMIMSLFLQQCAFQSCAFELQYLPLQVIVYEWSNGEDFAVDWELNIYLEDREIISKTTYE